MNAPRGLALLILLSLSSVAKAQLIAMWHSSTVWVNRGMCSAQFMFDGGVFQWVENLRVDVRAIKEGKVLARGTLEVPGLGESTAYRYAHAFFEGEALCEPDLTIQVVRATAVIEGKRVDLLKDGSLVARDFKPFPIRFRGR